MNISPPPGWAAVTVDAGPPLPPLAGEALPAPRSVTPPPGRALVVVNDAQRPTPTPWLLERLDLDWERDDLAVAVATGCHEPPAEEELRRIFGPFLERVRRRLILHRAGGEGFISFGTTRRGTPVEVNRCLEGVRSVICLGSVEPHYFAGWTGGRKSLVPGLSSLRCITANHRLALEGGHPGRPEACPVHLDLAEAASMIGRRMREEGGSAPTALNVVHRGGDIYGWRHGRLREVLDGLAETGEALFGRRVAEQYPAVLCLVGPPLDRDLYQALKAFENWRSAVAPGGTLIVAARCAGGMGPPTFRQFLEEAPPPEDPPRRCGGAYRLGDHKLAGILAYLRSGRRVVLWSQDYRPPPSSPVRGVATLAEALPGGGEAAARERPLLIVEDAAHLYPLARR